MRRASMLNGAFRAGGGGSSASTAGKECVLQLQKSVSLTNSLRVRTGDRLRIQAALMVVFALWAHVAVAGVNEDFLKGAAGGDLPAVKSVLAKGSALHAKDADTEPAAKAETKEYLPDVQKRIETIGKLLSQAAGQYQGCKTITEAVRAADALLDSYL